MESENLSSLIRLSVSDSQKTDSSIDVSFYRYIINDVISLPDSTSFDKMNECPCNRYHYHMSWPIELFAIYVFRVASHSEQNQMNASNLGIVFGPTLLRPQ